jgi:hypothetical protein
MFVIKGRGINTTAGYGGGNVYVGKSMNRPKRRFKNRSVKNSFELGRNNKPECATPKNLRKGKEPKNGITPN